MHVSLNLVLLCRQDLWGNCTWWIQSEEIHKITVCGDINRAYHLEVQCCAICFLKKHPEDSETISTEPSSPGTEKRFFFWKPSQEFEQILSNSGFQISAQYFPNISCFFFFNIPNNFQSERLNFRTVRSARPFAPPDEARAGGGGEPGRNTAWSAEIPGVKTWAVPGCPKWRFWDSKWLDQTWLHMAAHFMTSTITKRNRCSKQLQQ